MGWWRRKKKQKQSDSSEYPPFEPFVATSDFKKGDRLSFYGRYLYKWDPCGQLPAAFIACRTIKAGERVINDPTDPDNSDLKVITQSD